MKNFSPKKKHPLVALGAPVLFFVMTLGPNALQANMPVIDASAIAQSVENYTQLVKQVEMMVQEIGLLQDQIKNMTGHYGHGAVVGTIDDSLGTSWSDIANMVNQGINPGDATQVKQYKDSLHAYATKFPALDPSLQTANPRMQTDYTSSYTNAIAGLGFADSSFGQVDSYLGDLSVLRDRVDQTDNLKSAIDLNTAVNIKISQLNAQMAKLQAAQLALQANGQNIENNDYAAQSEFFSSK